MFNRVQALVAVIIAALVGAGPLVAQAGQQDGSALARAIDATDAQQWDQADVLARQAGDPIARDIVEWIRLRKGADDWAAYRAFLARNPDWPGLTLLHIKGEAVIPDDADPAEVVEYFRRIHARTGTGVLRLARALEAVGKPKAARVQILRAWRSFSLSKEETAEFLGRYGKMLAPFHVARLDMLLWRGLRSQAEALYPLVPSAYVSLARARLALRAGKRGVDALIRAVPAKLRDDPGLAYERVSWRLRKGMYESARDLLIRRSVSVAKLGRPVKWAGIRRNMARRELREGNKKRAYVIAANHFLASGPDYADLEWLAGYISLRKFNNPDRALLHFRNFRAAVGTPISFGRAGYWLGRAYDAKGDRKNAHNAYEFAARYQTSFYGQLAAERIGAKPDVQLAGVQKAPDWRKAPFVNSPLIRAAWLLNRADRPRLAEQFVRKQAEGADGRAFQELAEMAMDMGRPNIAVRLSKWAARKGYILPRTYFPVTDLARQKFGLAPEVAMAIARRESELDQTIISPAGARGLMQVMPRTARKMTKALGLPYSKAKLIEDWKYNAQIGSAYLAEQLKDFNGSYILAFAAYNAGPSRVRSWIRKYGDPRRDDVDQIDWIENIPFKETRNYVMRVIESLHVYRARLTGRTPRHMITRDLKRG